MRVSFLIAVCYESKYNYKTEIPHLSKKVNPVPKKNPPNG